MIAPGRGVRVSAPAPDGLTSLLIPIEPPSPSKPASSSEQQAPPQEKRKRGRPRLSKQKSVVTKNGGGRRASAKFSNLRRISVVLADKIRRAGEMSAISIAEEMVFEAVSEMGVENGGGCEDKVGKDVISVEKNVRRRLYDALKVLCSVGIIEKVGGCGRGVGAKGGVLRWKGVEGSMLGIDEGCGDVGVLEGRVRRKVEMVAKLEGEVEVVRRLCERNLGRKVGFEEEGGGVGGKVYLPFVLVGAGKDVRIDVESSDDMGFMKFGFSDQFLVHHDRFVVEKLLGRGGEGYCEKQGFDVRQVVDAGQELGGFRDSNATLVNIQDPCSMDSSMGHSMHAMDIGCEGGFGGRDAELLSFDSEFGDAD